MTTVGGHSPLTVVWRVRFAAMVHRAAWSPHAPRAILGTLAACWTIEALGTSLLPYLAFMPWLWASFYLVAAVSCIWAAYDFGNRRAVAVAGAASVVANVMRGGLLISGWLTDDPSLRNFDGWALASGVTAWWTLAFILAVLFFRRVAPLASAERNRT